MNKVLDVKCPHCGARQYIGPMADRPYKCIECKEPLDLEAK